MQSAQFKKTVNRPELFASPSARGSATRVSRSDGFQVYPGLHSLSPEYLNIAADVADRCTAEITGSKDSEGVADKEAIIGDFLAARTVSGTGMDPMTTPPVDNQIMRDELGLADDFVSTRDRAIWNAVFDCQFRSGRESAPLRMAKRSSSLFPEFTSDIVYRKNLFMYMLENLDGILNLIDRGDLEGAFTEYKFVIAYYLGVRTQADTVQRDAEGKLSSKPREVNDWLYAATGGHEGKRFFADKNVYVDGVPIADHFAGRKRTVYGLAASINMILAALFTGWRAVYLKLYAFTWHHCGNPDIERKVATFDHFAGVDVKAFDTTVARWMVDWFIQSFDGLIDPRLINLMRLAMCAPYYTTDPIVGGTHHFWMGDPFDLLSFVLCVGLPSGIAFNPDFGKTVMTATYLCVIDSYFHDVLEVGVSKILKGQHPTYGLLDMGDDGILLSSSQNFIAFLNDTWKRGDSVSPYFFIEKEIGVAFTGGVFLKDVTSSVKVRPNAISFATKTIWQEFPVDDPRRANWAHGWWEKQAFYADAPRGPEVKTIINEVFKKHAGKTLDKIADEWIVAHPELRAPALLSEADRSVFLNPDAIYYKVDVDKVSPHILDPIVHSIPPEVFEPILNKYVH